MSRKNSYASSRLSKITEENNELDAEIEDLYRDLKTSSESDDLLESSSDEEPIFRQQRPKILYHGTATRDRLYVDSVEVLEKRTHRIENNFDDSECSELLLPKQTIRIKGYRPPSERIYEATDKKKKFLREAELEKNQKFIEEYTFHPQINEKSKQIQYDPDHLIQPNNNRSEVAYEENVNIRPERFINERSKQIAQRTKSDFYSRQFRRSKTPRRSVAGKENQKSKIKQKKLSVAEQNELVERLTKPKEPIKPPTTTQTPKKSKPSDPRVFEHLVTQSLRKPKIQEEKFDFAPKMNPKSKELTKGVNKDLFEESLELHERQRRRAEEMKQYQDMAEAIECSFQPQIRRSRMPTPRKAQIAGMDDYLWRMKKSQQEREIKKKKEKREENMLRRSYRNSVVVPQPVMFEERKKNVKELDRSVDAVLSEIDQLLRY
ncbi:hypothetical protein TRFO_04154 [Tritrichomonas foetus]|uniref:Uncharacterized protein n=1 Tax=Tritrichomonas foetus TaxID=1144522 RepID=A0A1J4KLH8_9EUKA|nr:hypothetical protein TRFO_04154 [Tritrichomonas foetus]|eukprot:OHT10652.1 hypothetical protein TRFO_04154 [Tritrichomonas foetus]